MIEKDGKKYFTAIEIKELIKDQNTEIHKVWENLYPHFENVVLLEQVKRILYTAKKEKTISFVEYTRGINGKKKYYSFLLDDVLTHISNKRVSNMKFIEKE